MSEEDIQIIQDYQNCFASDSGKKVLANLKQVFYFDRSVVPIGEDAHIDVNRLIRNEGQRSVLIHILTQLNKQIVQAVPEHKPETVEEKNYIQ
jgi:CMP-2-keto-3-deoxyoctulosonic acid synthetase